MKKWLRAAAALACAGMLLTACSGQGKEDSSGSSVYDEEAVKQAAVHVVEHLNKGDYRDIVELMDDTMAEQLDEEKLKETWEPIAQQLGAFSEIEDTAFVEDKGYGIGAVLVKYENGELQVQVTYNEEMQISGLFFR